MKIFKKNFLFEISTIIGFLFFILPLALPITARAATTPSLGAAASYGILAGTYTNTTAGTTVAGDIGFTTGPAVHPGGTQVNYGSGSPYSTAGTDQGTALSSLNAQACDFNFGTPTDLSLLAQPLSPGVYCFAAAASIGAGGITLNGVGTYIFRIAGTLTTADNSQVALNGASACDVFWTPAAATTLGANTTFSGTVIDNSGITIGSTTTWNGRALNFATTVSTDTDTINVPACAVSPATLHVIKHVINDNGGTATSSAWTLTVASSNGGTGTGSAAGAESPGTSYVLQAGKAYAVTESGGVSGYLESDSSECTIASAVSGANYTCTITNNDIAPQLILTKIVVNDNGGTKVVSDFSLFIDGTSVVSGVVTTTVIGLHTVSETADAGYAGVIGGNCAASGTITLALGDIKTCTITNDDIPPAPVPVSSGGGGTYYVPPVPPLIDVVKVPSPLSLPGGPGFVTYTYTLRNIGTVPVNNITMVGDSCKPITLISGDANHDNILDLKEVWVYTCMTKLLATHTNVITATGWANGISAVDVANATVVVGAPVVPPLIHVTKVPKPLVLTFGGGKVTYTYQVTNPGTVPLSNVNLIDDKCNPVKYISGDVNKNSKLDPTETWTYTCQSILSKTTTNTVTASGDANELTATDFAIVTVVVPGVSPKLPASGLPGKNQGLPWGVMVFLGAIALCSFLFAFWEKRSA